MLAPSLAYLGKLLTLYVFTRFGSTLLLSLKS